MVMDGSQQNNNPGDSANVAESNPGADRVGREFVRQYYTLLNKSPVYLHRFYNDNSSFVHAGMNAGKSAKPVIGQEQIHRKILELNFRDCHAKILQMDSQETLNNGVVVQVSGELSNAGAPMRRFVQTFVLAPQSARSYYVRNDIFRYQDEVYTPESGDSAAAAAAATVTTASSATAATESAATAATPLHQQNGMASVAGSDDCKLPPPSNEYHPQVAAVHETEPLPQRSRRSNTSDTSAPPPSSATADNTHSWNAAEDENQNKKKTEVWENMVQSNNKVNATAAAAPPSGGADVETATATTTPAWTGSGGDAASKENTTGASSLDAAHHQQQQTTTSTEPKTYANMLSGTGRPPSSNPPFRTDTSSSHPPSTITTAASASPNTMNSSSTPAAPPPRGGGSGGASYGGRSSGGGHYTRHGPGESPYPREQCLFVGNIQERYSEDDMKTFFEVRYGKVLNFTMLTNRQGPLRCGFVYFSEPDTAQRALADRDRLEIDGYRLNIEKHRSSGGRGRGGGGRGGGGRGGPMNNGGGRGGSRGIGSRGHYNNMYHN